MLIQPENRTPQTLISQDMDQSSLTGPDIDNQVVVLGDEALEGVGGGAAVNLPRWFSKTLSGMGKVASVGRKVKNLLRR